MIEQELVIVVTGGNRGIGLEICRQLAERVATVVLTARNAASGNKAAQSIGNKHGSVRFHPLDVTSAQSMAELKTFVSDNFGRLDVLINNAGIMSLTKV